VVLLLKRGVQTAERKLRENDAKEDAGARKRVSPETREAWRQLAAAVSKFEVQQEQVRNRMCRKDDFFDRS
jgi:hypothetical protein